MSQTNKTAGTGALSQFTPEQMTQICSLAAKMLAHKLKLEHFKSSIVARKSFKWTGKRAELLLKIVDDILKDNKLFKGCDRARKKTAEFICGVIETVPEYTELFEKRIRAEEEHGGQVLISD